MWDIHSLTSRQYSLRSVFLIMIINFLIMGFIKSGSRKKTIYLDLIDYIFGHRLATLKLFMRLNKIVPRPIPVEAKMSS